MKKYVAVPAWLLLCALAPAALASSFAGTTGGSSAGGTSASSDSSSDNDDKLVRDAREDAAGFVATDGQVRSARLEAALRVMRERDASARESSDLALARAILALE